jgi:SPP1 gp7 family putative phage head morphogenesis protein
MLTGNQQLEEIYRKAGKEKPQDLIFGNRDYGKKLWNDSVMDITSNTGKEIARIVQQGLENGLSTEEIALNLKNTDQSGIFDLGRANRIARTEATRVVNESTVESYKQLGKAGIQVKKQWLSARDGKVRPSHAALDGQTVGSNEDFVLPAEYGSHKAASPTGFDQVGENVNCRCTVIPIIVD